MIIPIIQEDENNHETVCRIHENRFTSREEANARLLVKAPEMYDTLAGCESSLDIVLNDEKTPEYIKEIVQDIISTISHTLQKARGEK